MDRHARQARLAEIGTSGQARIARADVTVRLDGFAADVAARYLAGAGVARLHVRDVAVAEAARAIDPAVAIIVEGNEQKDQKIRRGEGAASTPSRSSDLPVFPSDLRDPVARDLACGAYEALMLLRGALEGASS
jgi:hypothetical protein